MSDGVLSLQAHAYHHASELPDEVWLALSQHEATTNIILPFAKKALDLPRDGKQLWIAVYDDTNTVTFVLSCTTGPLGDYPIFIVACQSPARLAQEEQRGRRLADALAPLVHCLRAEVSPQRVFSVFATAEVAKMFAKLFEAETGQHGIRARQDPYYDATLAYCTRETFVEPSNLAFPLRESDAAAIHIRLCRADMSHHEGIARLCKAFSETSWPYELDNTRAALEAQTMIENQQVWIHLVQVDGQAPEIACLVATTRASDHVTAVTKVFTVAHWRGRGCAARLLHRVCQEILQKKKRVVLYVGNSEELAPARKVYRKIGFQGLKEPDGQQADSDREKWLEIGFDGTIIGYW